MEATVAGGVGRLFRENDLMGIGISWGSPADAGRDQYTTEVFYRIQVLPSLALTPDLQIILNPAFNPDRRVIAVLGARLRLAL